MEFIVIFLHVYRIRTKLSYSHSSISLEWMMCKEAGCMLGGCIDEATRIIQMQQQQYTIHAVRLCQRKRYTHNETRGNYTLATHIFTCTIHIVHTQYTRKKFIKPMQDENGKRNGEKSLSLNIISIALRYAISPLLILF